MRVTHTRQVIFAKPDYWLLLDTMTPADDREHRYEAIFDLDAEDAVVDPATRGVVAEYGGQGFRIRPLRADGIEVEILKGQMEPAVQGRLPTGRHNELRPIPTAVYRWKARGPVMTGFVLEPRGAGVAWTIASVTNAGPNADIALTAGGHDIIDQGDGARLLFTRCDAPDKPKRVFQTDNLR